MSSLIDELARHNALICPGCRTSDWCVQDASLECGNCGAVWPVRNRVPDFFNHYHGREETPAPKQEALVTTIVRALDLVEDEEMLARVNEIVNRASTWACDSEALTAEINDLLDRFSGEQQDISLPPPAPDTNCDPQIKFDRHYIPATLAPSTCLSANVRVTNVGMHAWSSHVPEGLVLSGQWIDSASHPLARDITTTRFPIDVLPGRSISLPLRIQAPSSTGAYSLQVHLVRQDTGTPSGDSLEVPVHIAKPPSRLLRLFRSRLKDERRSKEKIERHPRTLLDYGEDHAAGVELIEAALKERAKPGARLLEVGSGTHPHLAWLTDYDVLALDISSPLLELGSLYFGDKFTSRLAFLCADAFNAPFGPQSFDAIAMFSALHHFPEPEVLLERLAYLLKPSGFLAVMCEPIGDTLEKPDIIRDLLKGINEQVFSIDEYRQIFHRAGLHVDHIRVDGDSLKAILSH